MFPYAFQFKMPIGVFLTFARFLTKTKGEFSAFMIHTLSMSFRLRLGHSQNSTPLRNARSIMVVDDLMRLIPFKLRRVLFF